MRKRKREREGARTVATSRKQSGRRPLKILLRIVCHFTSERSRSGRNGPRSHPRSASQREQTSVFTDSFDVTCGAYMRHRDSVQSALLLSPGAPLVPDLSDPRDASSRTDRSLGPRRANSTSPARLVRH